MSKYLSVQIVRDKDKYKVIKSKTPKELDDPRDVLFNAKGGYAYVKEGAMSLEDAVAKLKAEMVELKTSQLKELEQDLNLLKKAK